MHDSGQPILPVRCAGRDARTAMHCGLGQWRDLRDKVRIYLVLLNVTRKSLGVMRNTIVRTTVGNKVAAAVCAYRPHHHGDGDLRQ
jgi:hypothetical protein